MLTEPQRESSLGKRVVIGVLGMAGLFALLLVPLPVSISRDELYSALEDVAHGPLFAGVAFFTLQLLRKPTLRSYAATVALACCLAIATEFVQSLFARDSAWADVRTDVAGAIAGTAVWALWFDARARSGILRAALIAAAGLAAICVLAPVAPPVEARITRALRLPVLFDTGFSEWRAMTSSMTEDEDIDIAARGTALRVRLLAGDRPGVAISRIAPDWSDYEALVVDIENPGTQELAIALHVRDRRTDFSSADRFLTYRTLRPGERSALRFALSDVESGLPGRRLRLDEIFNVAIFRTRDGSDEFILHSIRLE